MSEATGTTKIVKLHLLGPVRIERGEKPLPGLRSRKALALLAYLALHGRPFPRTALADLFWPEKDERRGRANLSWAINHINSAMPDAFAADRHTVTFNAANPGLWLDTRAFTDLMAKDSVQAQQRAVELIRGELLEDLWLRDNVEYELWLRAEQERWRQMETQTLSALGDHFRAVGDFDRAIHYIERLLILTPWRENAHRRLVRLLAEAGRRSAALAQYETCRRVLLEELNVEPSPATEELAAAIRDNRFNKTARPQDGVVKSAAPNHHLPRQYTAFFGRERELARIEALLASPETALVTIIGPGGVGKTRLALAAGEKQKERYAHGVHFVPLAGLEHSRQFVSAVAEVIGFTFSEQPDRPSPREQLLDYLSRRELLLIIDNAEHLDGLHEELLPVLRGAPGVQLLVTTRHELGLHAAALLFLLGLPYPDLESSESPRTFPAMQLLLDRIHRRYDAYAALEHHPALAEICRLVQGYPLALELAAGMMPVASPAEIVTRTKAGLDALRVTYHDMPSRHLSLRALFSHSWALLSPQEKAVLPLLTLFYGGFTAAAARAVTGVSPEILRGLAAKSLLQIDEDGRFSMHNVPRHFLGEHLDERAQIESSHAAYYMRLFTAEAGPLRGPDQVAMRARLLPDEENLRAAWKWMAAAGEQEAITAGLRRLFVYWSRRGYAPLGVAFFADAAETVRQRGLANLATALHLHALGCRPDEEACRHPYHEEIAAAAPLLDAVDGPLQTAVAARLARLSLACLVFTNSNKPQDRALLERCSNIIMAEGSDLDIADLQLIQARLHQHDADYVAARHLFQEAIAIYRRRGDLYALADALYLRARMAYQTGDFSSAAVSAVESQELYERLGNRQGMQDSQTTLGFIAFQDGRHGDAHTAFETSLHLADELGNRVRVANNLSNLGVIALDMGDVQAARAWYDRAYAAFSELNDDGGIAIVLANQGILAEAMGDLGQARLYTEKSLSIRERIGDKNGLAYAHNNLGYIQLALEETMQALDHFRRVLRQGIAAENANWQADAMGGIALTWARMGKLEEGLELAAAVLREEAASRYVRDKLDDFLEQLAEELPAGFITARLAKGEERPLATVAREVYDQVSLVN